MNNNSQKLIKTAETILHERYFKEFSSADAEQLNYALSRAAVTLIYDDWQKQSADKEAKKRAFYISAEFLMGRAFYNNLHALGVLDEVKSALAERGTDFNLLEDIEDDALGNGGLGRLAACFLDSAATLNLPLDGYGIRYRYGLFWQKIENGFQTEVPDAWQQYGDPWSVKKDEEKVTVEFGDGPVYAIPYDMPIIGYGGKTVNTLRLWQSEPVNKFDFDAFNRQKYADAVKERDKAEAICMLLYPNDDTDEGKKLRLKQQYFMSSASIQDVIRKFVQKHGTDFNAFPQFLSIQLNDTHPTVAIPEFIRILTQVYDVPFNKAFSIAQKTFAYTNHTIMAEALEKWNCRLFRKVLPKIYPVVAKINKRLTAELTRQGKMPDEIASYQIIDGGLVHMSRMAVYSTFTTNGVARLHTEILKNDALKNWYDLYPERFQNKTNGVTQRRWLGVCNPLLCNYLNSLGVSDLETDLMNIQKLNRFADDKEVLAQLHQIKCRNKQTLSDYIEKREGVRINPSFLFDIQVKRLHEYKRQLMNAFSILYLYFGLKDGSVKDFSPTAFLFGAKAAPGYFRAKGIIKYINEIANLVNNDSDTKDQLFVHFVSNYNVTYAEKLIPAADVSEQISTAGTEASGTSNMKFMLNGAVTLGTYDGANIEIVELAGSKNNYIFGKTVEELAAVKDSYNPMEIYEQNPRIRRVLDTLVDGTFSDGGTGMFQELYDSLLKGASWHKPDHYFILLELESYVAAKLQANRDFKDWEAFTKKALANMAGSGYFSSDRTIKEYAEDIWHIG